MPEIRKSSEYLLQRVRSQRQSAGISEVEVRSSIQQMQFDLTHDANASLVRKYAKGEEFFEYRSVIHTPDRSYRIVWELDWPGRGDVLHFLDVSIIEVPPTLARNSVSQ